MNYDKLLTSAPVNKTAAMVTQQPPEEFNEYKRLVSEIQNVDKAIIRAKQTRHLTKEQFKELGQKKADLQKKLTIAKDRKKNIDPDKLPIAFHFMEICRENMHRLEFAKYLRMACERRGDK